MNKEDAIATTKPLPPEVTIPPELVPFVRGRAVIDDAVIVIKRKHINDVAARLLLLGGKQQEEDPRTIVTPELEIVMIGDWLWLDEYTTLIGDRHET